MDSPAKCEKREIDQEFVFAVISSRRTLEIGVLDFGAGLEDALSNVRRLRVGWDRGGGRGTETIERVGVGSMRWVAFGLVLRALEGVGWGLRSRCASVWGNRSCWSILGAFKVELLRN